MDVKATPIHIIATIYNSIQLVFSKPEKNEKTNTATGVNAFNIYSKGERERMKMRERKLIIIIISDKTQARDLSYFMMYRITRDERKGWIYLYV